MRIAKQAFRKYHFYIQKNWFFFLYRIRLSRIILLGSNAFPLVIRWKCPVALSICSRQNEISSQKEGEYISLYNDVFAQWFSLIVVVLSSLTNKIPPPLLRLLRYSNRCLKPKLIWVWKIMEEKKWKETYAKIYVAMTMELVRETFKPNIQIQ